MPEVQDALQAAQLEKLRLETTILKAEFNERGAWHRLFGQMVPIITALIAIAGFGWGVVQYRDQQEKDRSAQERQSQRESEAAERDFMKPWIDSQREIYLKALTAVSTIANTNDASSRKKAEEEFWSLYHGKMILVETKSVSGAMVSFGTCLDGTDTCTRTDLNTRSKALATAMAQSMASTASQTYREFAANQFKYSSDGF